MRRHAVPFFSAFILVFTFILISGGLFAKRAVPEMSPDQKILHALSRLTFGARPGDVPEVRQEGLDHWIDRQLHPASIAENPVLEAKLAPLDSLRMSTAEMVQRYPTRQMVKAMMEGKLPLPSDPATRAGVQLAIARYQAKKGADDSADGDFKAGRRSADDHRTPEERAAYLESLAPDQLPGALLDLSRADRKEIAAVASPALRRKLEVLASPLQIPDRDLTEGKLLRAIYSNRQLDEVLTDFWYNHFNVYLNKGADRSLVTAYERDVIQPRVLGKFKDLLVATAESPAMLFYLDNWESVSAGSPVRPGQKRARGLNENYGRELMELHTLGVDGGYTQKDVTEVARCFTGWTIRQPQRGGGFEFNARVHDKGEKHVLGVTIPAGGGMDDGLTVLNILARHPSTARFISRSLAMRFVSDNPPDSLVNRMADTFTASDGDLRQVMAAMLNAPEFWDPANFRSKVKSPLEMVVSAVRSVNGDVNGALSMATLMTQLGEPLYRKQEPTGYSNRSAEWMNSASLLARMNFANALAQGSVAGVEVDPAQFAGDPQQIERRILLTNASADAQAAIQAGLDAGDPAARKGPLVAGLTMGSPDFQRR